MKTKKTQTKRWLSYSSTILVLIYLPLKTDQTTQMFDYEGLYRNGISICPTVNREHVYSGFIKKGLKIAFYVNNADPKIKEFVDDGSGSNKRFKIISRGATCMTFDTTNRYQFFAMYITAQTDPSPTFASNPFFCKVERYILSNDLIPCDSNIVYQSVESSYRFDKAGHTKTWDRILPYSILRILKTDTVGEIPRVDLDNTHFDLDTHIDDNFIEMLVFKPFQAQLNYGLSQHSEFIYNNARFILLRRSLSLTIPMVLKSVTHNSLPGFHFLLDPAEYDGTMGFAYSRMRLSAQRANGFNFHLSNPGAFDDLNCGLVEIRMDLNGGAPNLKVFVSYNLWLKKVAGGKIRFQLDRLDVNDDTNILNSISVEVVVTQPTEYIHFGMMHSEGVFFYKSDTEAKVKFYEVVWAWHDHTSDLQIAEFEKFVHPDHFIVINQPEYYVIFVKYLNYPDRANLNSKSLSNLFGVRLVTWYSGHMVYPIQKMTLSAPPNNNPEGRCGFVTYGSKNCAGYVQIKKKGDTPDLYYVFQYHERGPNCPKEKCHICYYEDNCLYPKDGYNMDLVAPEITLEKMPTQLLSSFEGNTPEAVARREGRVQYTDNLGLKYWIRCPLPCNSLFPSITILNSVF